ncbi:MAG: sigma 54-interacting transcriptional regulator, partial [Candidatus Wallbacteria bacterium]|nr:sigma 54-interacting transcriptional regulator [Candidatus Wallbacteria bacterium]
RSDWLTQGPAVEDFERALCENIGSTHAVACNSGTAALHLAALAAIMVSLGREHSVMQHFIERQLRATDRHLRAHGLQVALLQEDTAAVEYLIMRRQSDIQAYKLAAGQAVAALATLVQEDPDDTADGYARIGRVHDRYGAAICETIAHPPPKGPEAEKVAAGIQEQTLELSQLLSDRLTGDDQKLGTLELSVRDALAGFRRAVFVYAGLFVLVVMAMTGSLAASVVGAAMGLDRGMKAVMAGDLRTRLETLEAGGPLLGQPAELREVFYCFDQMVSRLAALQLSSAPGRAWQPGRARGRESAFQANDGEQPVADGPTGRLAAGTDADGARPVQAALRVGGPFEGDCSRRRRERHSGSRGQEGAVGRAGAGPAHRRRRPREDPRDPREPDRQRGEVHAQGRQCGRAGASRGRHRARCRVGFRSRNPAGRAKTSVREIRSRGLAGHREAGRRPWPLHRPGVHAGPRRTYMVGGNDTAGLHVPGGAAGEAGVRMSPPEESGPGRRAPDTGLVAVWDPVMGTPARRSGPRTPLRILVVEDDEDLLGALAIQLGQAYDVVPCSDPREAFVLLQREFFHIVLTDQQMPGMTGLELMKKAHEIDPATTFVFLTVVDNVETAVDIVRSGAADYLRKPIAPPALMHRLEVTAERIRLQEEVTRLRRAVRALENREELVGTAPAIVHLLGQMEMVSATKAPVLLVGETGSGKEVVARLLHRNSPRAGGPFIPVNCTALPEGILDSELFGHAKGAFTGAERSRSGLFEEANGGTLFLDEIGDITPELQSKLLRVLQESEIRRVGENRILRIDVRVVAATHRDLPAMVAEGRFREDLFYRLNVVTLRVPPVRERRDDIPLLLEHFVHRTASEYQKPVSGVSPKALHRALQYGWPGNVREIENRVRRGMIFCTGDLLAEEDLFGTMFQASGPGPKPGMTLKEAERIHVMETLKACDNHRRRTAKTLGVSLRALQYKLRKYGIREGR